jgi:hypothetical protein
VPTYSSTAVDDRLLGTVAAIDAGGAPGNLKLLAGGAVVCTMPLARPCGTVSNTVLTFNGNLIDVSAVGSSRPITGAFVEDSNGDTVISGLTAGVPTPGVRYDITLSAAIINPGDVVELTSVQIVGAP